MSGISPGLKTAAALAVALFSLSAAAPAPADFATETHPFTLRQIGQKVVFAFKVEAVGEVSAEVHLKTRGQMLQVVLHGPRRVNVRARKKSDVAWLAYIQNTPDVLSNGKDWTVVITSFTDEAVVTGDVTLSYPKPGAAPPSGGTAPPPAPPGAPPATHPAQPPAPPSDLIRLSPNSLKAPQDLLTAFGLADASIEISGIHFDADHTIEALQKNDRAYLQTGSDPSAPPGVALTLKGLAPGWYLVEAQFLSDGMPQTLAQKGEILSGNAEIAAPAQTSGNGSLYFPVLLKVVETAGIRIIFSGDHVDFDSVKLRKLAQMSDRAGSGPSIPGRPPAPSAG